jgi:sphinganine-1-phosphate aldolase
VHPLRSGYTQSCATILKATRKLKQAIQSDRFSELYVLGDPMVSVVAFSVDEKCGLKQNDIYAVGDLMSKKGWHLSALSGPPALHLAMTVSGDMTDRPTAANVSSWAYKGPQMLTAKAVDTLLDDLRGAIDEIKASPPDSGDLVALYGELAGWLQ